MFGAGIGISLIALIANFAGFQWLNPFLPGTVTLLQPGAQSSLAFSSTILGVGRSSIVQSSLAGFQTVPVSSNGYMHAGNPFSSGQFTAQDLQALPPGRQNLASVCAGNILLHAFDMNANDPANGSNAMLAANPGNGPISGFVPNHYAVLGTDTAQLNGGNGVCISGTYFMAVNQSVGWLNVPYAKAACSTPQPLSYLGPIVAGSLDIWEDPNPTAGAGSLKIAFITPQGDAAVAEAGSDRTFGTGDDIVQYFQSSLPFPYAGSIAVSKYYVVVLNRSATTQPAFYYRYAGNDGIFGTADDSATTPVGGFASFPGIRTDLQIDKSAAEPSLGSRITWVERDTQSPSGNQIPSRHVFADLSSPLQMVMLFVPQLGTVQGNNPMLVNHGIAGDALIYSILDNPPYAPTLFKRYIGSDGLWGTSDDVVQALVNGSNNDVSIDAQVLDQTVLALMREESANGGLPTQPNQLFVIDLGTGAVSPLPPNPQFLSNPMSIGLAARGAALVWYEGENEPIPGQPMPFFESRSGQLYTFSRTKGIGSQLTEVPIIPNGTAAQRGSWGNTLLYTALQPSTYTGYAAVSQVCD